MSNLGCYLETVERLPSHQTQGQDAGVEVREYTEEEVHDQLVGRLEGVHGPGVHTQDHVHNDSRSVADEEAESGDGGDEPSTFLHGSYFYTGV